jgi:dolichol kinase
LERLHERLGPKAKAAVANSALVEEGRQVIHILAGYVIIAMLFWFGLDEAGVQSTELLLLGLLISGLMLINMKMLGMWIGPFEWVLKIMDRRKDIFPARGPLMYLVGVLLILSFTKQSEFMLASIAVFATGDGFSTLVGMRVGRHKLPWNGKKSFEGTLAFFVTGSIAAYPFIGPLAIFYSGVLALVESLDFHIDDNLLVPFVAVILNTFI